MDNPTSNPSRTGRLRRFLFGPSSLSLVTVLAIGMVSGLVFWGGFNAGMDATNSLEFCNSCHEMRDTVFQEYKESVHYQNRSGVRAICSDCHVPKDWVHKFVRKVGASQELYVKFVSGAIDTPEKFEANRMHLAQRVWKAMKENDSHECRNCHSWEAMHMEKQSPRSRTAMEKGRKEGKTCIDCHKGVAHLLPKEFKEEE